MKNLLLPALLLVALLAGCSTSKPVTCFVLAPETCLIPKSPNAVRLRGISLPGYLESKEAILRKGNHVISSMNSFQWADSYRRMLQDSIEWHLAKASSPAAKPIDARLEFRHFEIDDSHVFHVELSCKYISLNTPRFHNIAFQTQWDGKDPEDIVRIQDLALARIAQEILENAK